MIDPSELIERAALEDVHRAMPPSVAAVLNVRSASIGGAFVGAVGGLPAGAIVLNRTIGLGVDTPATEAGVRQIVRTCTEAGVGRYFVHCHPRSTPAALRDWLRAAGLEKARGWQKFERGVEPPASAMTTDLTVRAVGPAQGAAFAAIVCDAFDLGEVARPWLAGLPGRAGWHVFMSFEGEVPAGTGALFVRDGIGWLDFGATAPRFRKRGSQAALMAARIVHARSLGCRRLYTCTGEAVPGDPQHSFGNITKAGFEATYVRENYASPRPAA